MTPPTHRPIGDSTPRKRSQYDDHLDIAIEIGRRRYITTYSVLAAAFYAEQGVAPNPAALEMAEQILLGDDELA